MADPVVTITNGVPTSGTGTITTLGAVVAALGTPMQATGGSVAITGNVPVTGTFWQATQPVSLASVPSHAVTNAGTFPVQVTSAPSTAVTNAGTFPVQAAAILAAETTKVIGVTRTADGAGNLLTSTSAALDVNIKSGGGSGGTSSTFGSAFPTAGTALGASDGTNMIGLRVKAASTAPVATDPALVVAISPNSVNANGLTTPANSAPVVAADGYAEYETVAASATAQVLGATGATGDYLAGVLVFPGTAGCGVVTILDNATTIGTFAGGGTTALPSLVPFLIPVGLFSVSGAWKITTGANVTAVGIGNFT